MCLQWRHAAAACILCLVTYGSVIGDIDGVEFAWVRGLLCATHSVVPCASQPKSQSLGPTVDVVTDLRATATCAMCMDRLCVCCIRELRTA